MAREPDVLPEGMDEFLVELDGMIEATQEFIGDDGLTPFNDPEHRFMDLACLMRVRELWLEVYKPVKEVENG